MELALVNGLISFQAPLFGLQEMIFTRMEGNMELDNGTLKVNRLQVAGDQIQGDFQGKHPPGRGSSPQPDRPAG